MSAGEESVGERAYLAWEQGDWAAAGPLLEQAAAEADDAEAAALWFDAALAYKFLRDWPRAYELGLKAAALVERGAGEPAYWNLGIAATALREWETARDAWAAFGIELPPGDGDLRINFGMTPIRLEPDGAGEVVWAQRICPTRAIIRSIPMVCDRGFGDVILHDGAPNGERTVGDRQYPVFDEIQVWQSADIPTWMVDISADAAGYERLVELFGTQEYGIEASNNVKPVCSCCSKGSVEQHMEQAQTVDMLEFWVAAPEETVLSTLDAWESEAPDVRAFANLTLVIAEEEEEEEQEETSAE